ncbi:MAG: lipoyl synthase [Bacteroidetes bacterium]|uniref:Lipoyl synthase n=1 Tax=Candidatus Gallipaludibacter merdavium TaxID=2840839 RepID=A0A9D9HUE0_9BACT|nr:lipoyl synthase [Candidatus Gallipaludibacter merdavium]
MNIKPKCSCNGGSYLRKPAWLKISRQNTEQFARMHELVEHHNLHTICSSGRCPNQSECWSRGTATFMILGDVCTRGCRFCNTKTGVPLPPDVDEPSKLAESIRIMQLKHAVITSVTRDDLPDGGAQHWGECVRRIREVNPETTIEVLIPDFEGRQADIATALAFRPDVVAHNLETVERLTPLVRAKATYRRSLEVLRYVASLGFRTKTGIMVGLGETSDEVSALMDDALEAGCSVITIGQYLQPSKQNVPVVEYVTPEQFAAYRDMALAKGFKFAESAPLVRSSYHAERHVG